MRIRLHGCGRWGRHLLRDLRTLGAEVRVVDPSAEARAAALAAGAAGASEHVEGPAPDGIVVATPASTHAAVLAPLLGGSVPVLVEKPLTADPAEARRIAARAKCPVHVTDKWRHHPAVARLAELARTQALGVVIGLRTRRLQDGHRHADVDALWTLAPHDLAIARTVLGRIPPLRSVCREFRGSSPEPAAGVLAHFAGRGGWLALEVSAARPARERLVELVAEEGSAWMDDPEAMTLHVRRHGEAAIAERLDGEAPLQAFLRAWTGFVAGGPPPAGTLADAVEVVQLIDALHRGPVAP